jgi:hypothetical protein
MSGYSCPLLKGYVEPGKVEVGMCKERDCKFWSDQNRECKAVVLMDMLIEAFKPAVILAETRQAPQVSESKVIDMRERLGEITDGPGGVSSIRKPGEE